MTDIKAPQFSADPRHVVRGVNEDGTLAFEQVGVEELDYRGRWGATALSNTENTIAVGQHQFVIDDEENLFRIGDDVLITSLDDFSGFMWGEIVAKSSAPTELTVHVEDISNGILTSSNWELQVVARPKGGITKDTSTTTGLDLRGAGPFTFTVTVGKFFPIGGKLLIIPLVDRSSAFVGQVKAYSGTSLVVEKNSTNITADTSSCDAWAIALLDAPQNAIPFYQINGLRIRINGSDPAHDIDISAGSVRDSSDTIDLILPAGLTKRLDAAFTAGTNQGAYVQSANLVGTISSSGLAVTGTGTSFQTDFGDLPFLSDFNDQYNVWKGFDYAAISIITKVGGVTSGFQPDVGSNIAGFSLSNLTASASSYKRGGWASGETYYAIVLVRKDSDGSVDVISCAFNGNGQPDLPTGYTYYRVIGAVYFLISATEMNIDQPLHGLNASRAEESSIDDRLQPKLAGLSNVQEALDVLAGSATDLETNVADIEERFNVDGLAVVGLRSQTFTLADDTAVSFAPPGGINALVAWMCTGTHSATAPSGIFVVRLATATAPVSVAVSDGTNVDYRATSLTGTSGGAGSDGKISFGSNGSGNLYIQNRVGASRTIRLTVIAF